MKPFKTAQGFDGIERMAFRVPMRFGRMPIERRCTLAFSVLPSGKTPATTILVSPGRIRDFKPEDVTPIDAIVDHYTVGGPR